MADWRTFFGLESGCTDKCGNNIGPAPDSACDSYAIDADGSNKEPGAAQLSCEDITKGFHCKATNFLGKLNAWIKGLLCWLSNHENRITNLEGLRRLIDIEHDPINNRIIEHYSDGTTEFNDLSQYIDDTDQVQSLSYNSSTGVLTAINEDGSTVSTTIPPASSGWSSRVTLTSSTTWTVPSGVTSVLATVIGGGGGGSGGRGGINPANNGGRNYVAGGGGGAGGFAQELVTGLTPGSAISITVGAGGGGANFNSRSNSIGSTGGTSSFGSFVSATGGTGGVNQMGGSGGRGISGNINYSLGAGETADQHSGGFSKGGAGGGGTRGNGTGQTNGSAGVNGLTTGSGGGGSSYGGRSGARGGNGSNGSVTIYF